MEGASSKKLAKPLEWVRVLLDTPALLVYFYPFARRVACYYRADGFVKEVVVFCFRKNKEGMWAWQEQSSFTKVVRAWLRKHPHTLLINGPDGRHECNLLVNYSHTGKEGDLAVFYPVVLSDAGGCQFYRFCRNGRKGRGRDEELLRTERYQDIGASVADGTPHFHCSRHPTVPLMGVRKCGDSACRSCRGHGTLGRCRLCDKEAGHNCPICLRGNFQKHGTALTKHLTHAHGFERFPIPVEVRWRFLEDRDDGADSKMERSIPRLVASLVQPPAPAADE